MAIKVVMKQHLHTDLQTIFNQCFGHSHSTLLVGDADEPVYIPKGLSNAAQHVKPNIAVYTHTHHVIYYRQDFYRSALHEIAHWCIAGENRRQLLDFGYWYAPDGRTQAQQQAFQQAEIKPQALEYAFCLASDTKFRVSVDNLETGKAISPDELQQQEIAFFEQVKAQLNHYVEKGFPKRAQIFIHALLDYYQPQNLSRLIKPIEEAS